MGNSEVENFYKNDAYQGFGDGFSLDDYSEYVSFVKSEVGQQEIIEIGSGLGVAAYSLYLQKVRITASDLYPIPAREKFLQMNVDIPVLEINATKNSLANESVGNYSLYQVLEHIEDPMACFRECFRTLKPGGKLMIVSPNLVSPATSLLTLVNCISGRWKSAWFKNTDGYTFPYGANMVEVFAIFCRNLFLAVKIRIPFFKRKPRFRKPCFKIPAISDSDAIFLSEPLVVRDLLREAGFEVASFQSRRRLRSFAGSLWISARKPMDA